MGFLYCGAHSGLTNTNQRIHYGYMNTKTVINIKTDKILKVHAQKVAAAMGLPLGTIVNAYLRDFVREKRIVFAVPPTPNKKTQMLLRDALRDTKEGKNISPAFTSGEAMDEYLARHK